MKKKSQARFIRPFILLLFGMALFLGYKINEKKGWVTFPAISTWMPYEKWFQFYDREVNGSIQYHHLVDDVYTNGSNMCVALFDGIVLQSEDNSLTVLHDNGVQIMYGKLENVLAKTDERILKGQSLAVIKDSLTLSFKKDNQSISYEEVMKL